MMPISSQKDNQGYRKSAAAKESTLFKKIVLKFWNPKFNNLCKIAFIISQISTFWSSEVNKAILEQVKVTE